MATQTVLIDDLDGTEAFRTVRFGFDGHVYEIDLSREHFDALKHGLEPWVRAAREVSKYASPPKVRGADKGPRMSVTESRAIRDWARAHGYPTVGEAGKIRADIVAAYRAAHTDHEAAA